MQLFPFLRLLSSTSLQRRENVRTVVITTGNANVFSTALCAIDNTFPRGGKREAVPFSRIYFTLFSLSKLNFC